MVLGPIVNLILMLSYLLLGYITFKELSNKKADPLTHHRILLKWMTSAVFFSSFWIVEAVFTFTPTSLIKLPMGLWILMPQFYGEYTIYNMFAEVFEKLEYYFRNIRNVTTASFFGSSFAVSSHLFSMTKQYISTDRLRDFQNKIRELNKELDDELKFRKFITNSKQPSSNQFLRDSTVLGMGSKPPTNPRLAKPTGQIYTPVGMFTKQPVINKATGSVLDTVGTNISEESYEKKDKRHKAKINSREREDRQSLQNLGKASSYIDAKLTEKLKSSDLYATKDEFRKSKKA
uniref:Uncharacterized protein n=1 Tax=Euplotes harpa TaxID=151035 RepID=A0A7S3JAQ8_9SPIT|eukprot:CAMPEP_0168335044 /NCGR_PEP_ID=MMETSP0213-20121227/10662_1 /TAXON_ID=151035 /ORGANISM="Euplotes harpa, Strain FSP1.4" /LENGTH=289 /DNA_ID=CAMNT_0008339871 /DNA_START=34 /DNA_END=903 /DNA_ORIENTATION=-